MSADKRLMRIQAISGLLFAVFLLLHLGNTTAAIAGQSTYDRVQQLFRWYYQFPVVELIMVIGSAGVHMVAGVLRIRLRRRRSDGPKRQVNPRLRLHRYTGYYMMLAFVGHVIATRGPDLLGHTTDFSYLNFGMTVAPAFFYPYYAGLFFSGLYHMFHGTIAALRFLGVKLPKIMTAPRSKLFWSVGTAGAAVALACVLALGGDLYQVDQARHTEWRAFASRFVPGFEASSDQKLDSHREADGRARQNLSVR